MLQFIRLFAIYFIITTTSALIKYPDCFFESKHHTDVYYDLSVLSLQEWDVTIAETNNSARLSLCGTSSLLNKKLCPDSDSSVCIVEQIESNFRELIPNLGSRIQGFVEGNNSLIVSLDGGQQCNESKKYSTTIHFICNNDTNAQIISSLVDCNLTVKWPTIASCPISDSLLKKCVIGSGSNDFINLRPLYRRHSYKINSQGRSFELNICGALPLGHCNSGETVTACELDPKTNATKVIGMSKKASLKLSEDGPLLLYKAHNIITKIEFICNKSIAAGQPRLKSKPNNSTYIFEIESSYACSLETADCTFPEKDVLFDLSPLKKESENWMFKNNNSTFYINVCKSLNPTSNAKCSDGPVGVCQIFANGESLNLGMVADGPKLEGDKLTVKYIGGSKCSDDERYSSIIRFICSKKLMGPYPTNQIGCQRTFEWLTPSACPKLVNEGNDCIVYDPRTGDPYNVQKLRSGLDYTLTSENITFYINLCGSLINSCNNLTNVSVCMKLQNESKQISIGYTRNKLEYLNGRLSFNMIGDECRPGKRSTVTVLLLCHRQSFVNNSQPELLHYVHDECEFMFTWHLNLACRPFQQFECKLEYGNKSYDLSSLSNPSFNHVSVSKSENESFTYFINVCQPVISGYDSLCQRQSGVCLKNNLESDVTKRFTNLGDVTNASLKMEDNDVVIEYKNGALCPSDVVHYSTKIYLYCDEQANDTNPTFLKENNCKFEFSWRTRAACPVSLVYDHPPVIHENGNCSAVNPSSGQMFDLIASLEKKSAAINIDGNSVMIGICHTIPSDKCSTGSGACLLKNGSTISYGNENSNLLYDGGIYFLNYIDGDKCQKEVRRSTVIKFICSTNISLEPQIEIDNCSLTVFWFTHSVCKEKINCITNGKVIDLSPLVNNDSNYITNDDNGTEFFINVCHPVSSTTEIKCIPGSSSCAAYRKKDGTIVVQNLGFQLSPPEVDDNGEIVLKYSKGSRCTSGFESSSSIYFKCDPSVGKGHPVFDSIINKCEYKFIWATNVICDVNNSTQNISDSCLIKDPKLNVSVDISIMNREVYKVNGFTTTTYFHISICNESNLECESEICKFQDQKWLPCGKRRLVEFDDNSTAIKLIYGDETSGNSRTAEIWLICNLTAGSGRPQLNYESDNMPIFQWQTDVVCQALSRNNWKIAPDSPGINKTGTAIGVVVSILVVFIVIIIIFMKRQQLSHSVCSVLFRRCGNGYEYTREIDDNTEL